jgi:phage baseplate assembly protein gpV
MRVRSALLSLIPLLALTACGDKDKNGKAPENAEKAHEHVAPHGGELLELGDEQGHVELVHDDEAGKITMYIYGSETSKPISVEKPSVTIQQKDGTAIELTMVAQDAKADGTAHTWVGEHAAVKVEPLDGRVRLKIAGKQYQSPLEPPDHKPHK